MTKTVFFTDPHLGLDRMSHTSAKSRAALREHLYEFTCNTIDEIKAVYPFANVYCLGDLLDKYSNREPIIVQAGLVAKRCQVVMAGNHDQINKTDEIGTLELLARFPGTGVSYIIAEDRTQAYACAICDHDGKTVFVFVPHAMSQELFQASLDAAHNLAISAPAGYHRVLCLHCNVGEPHEHNLRETQTALWLTPELQLKMLEDFQQILVGHEHVPQSLHDGRLLVLGNVYPLGFGEIADRFIYLYDSDTREIKQIPIVKADEEYINVTVDEIIGSDGDLEYTQRLIEITGTIKPQDYPAFSRAVANLWKKNEHFFAVNPHVKVDEGSRAKPEREAFVPRTLPETIGESIKSTPYEPAYREIADALKDEDELE